MSRSGPRVLVALLCAALLGSVLTDVPPARAAEGGGTLAVGLTGAGSTAVDERTGLLSFSLDLGEVPGVGAAAVPLGVSYAQSSAASGGLGSGWSWNLPRVEAGSRIVFADGRSFDADAKLPSGMSGYKLQDAVFTTHADPLPAGSAGCAATRLCKYSLTKGDGTVSVFDTKGLLSAVSDRDGHVSRYTWDTAGGLTKVEGGFPGARVSATIESSSTSVVVTFPERADGTTRPTATLTFENSRLKKVTAASKAVTELTWTQRDAFWFPATWSSSSGARVDVQYKKYNPGIWAVDTVTTKDTGANNKEVASVITVNLNPANNANRNYTGFDKWHDKKAAVGAGTTDALVASDDRTFTYRTSISDEQFTTTRVFDNRHLKISETTEANVGGANRAVARTEYTYPGSSSTFAQLPAMYQVPIRVKQTVIDPAKPTSQRETETITEFDGSGRPVLEVADDIEIRTAYDVNQTEPVAAGVTRGYGLPTEVTRTVLGGNDRGRLQKETMTLSADRKAVVASLDEATDPADGAVKKVAEKRTAYATTGEVAEVVTTQYTAGVASVPQTERTDYRVDGRLRVVTATDAAGATSVQKLDVASGLPVEEIDAAGLVTTRKHDGGGREVETSLPDGTIVKTQYTEAGLAGTALNATIVTRSRDGFASREVRDALGRPIRTEDNQKGGKVVAGSWRVLSESGYDRRGRVEFRKDAAGRRTGFAYDDVDRQISATGPDGSSVRTEYNEVAGTTTQRVFAKGAAAATITQVSTVDPQGRLTRRQTTYGDGTPGNTTGYTYTGFGQQKTAEESAFGQKVSNEYDAAGHMTGSIITADGVEDPAASASYLLDALGNRTGKTLEITGQGAAVAHALGYDESGRPVTSTDPGGATTATGYDAAGRVITTTYPDGRVFHSAYHPTSGKVAATWWILAGGAEAERKEFEHDPATGKVAAVWFTADKAGSILRYSYLPDATLAAVTYPDGSAVRYEHSDAGGLQKLIDPAGVATEFGYDAAGKLTSAVQAGARVEYEWDRRGTLSKITRKDPRASGATTSTTLLTHDDAGQVLTVSTTGADGAVIEKQTHGWNAQGQLETTTADHGSGGARITEGPLAGADVTTTTHRYDAQSRLAESTVHAGSDAEGAVLLRTEYALNAASDVTAITETTPDGTSTTAFQLDDAGRQSAVESDGTVGLQDWDANGNLVRDSRGYTFEHTADNRVSSWTSPDGETTTIGYRPDGSRAAKSLPDGTRVETFALPGSTAEVIAERLVDDGGSRMVSSLIGVAREALTGADTTWLVGDRRGDVVATLDAGGRVSTRNAYSDFGVESRSGAAPGTYQPFGYAGAYTDRGVGGTGHLWLAARTYAPQTTHFTSQDTADLLNRYTYAAANPIAFSDPTGHMPGWREWTSLGMAALGLGIAIGSGGGIGLVLVGILVSALDLTLTLDHVGFWEEVAGTQLLSDAAQEKAGWGLFAASLAVGLGPSLTKLVIKKLTSLGSKLKTPTSSIVDSAIGVHTYEDLAGYAMSTADLRKQNCVSATCTVRDSLLAGELRTADGGGGKYITKKNYTPANPGSTWEGPFTTDGQLYRHMSMYPDGSVFTTIERGDLGQAGALKPLFDALEGGHFSTAVRTHPENSGRMMGQIFQIDGRWGTVTEIDRRSNRKFDYPFYVMFEGVGKGRFQ